MSHESCGQLRTVCSVIEVCCAIACMATCWVLPHSLYSLYSPHRFSGVLQVTEKTPPQHEPKALLTLYRTVRDFTPTNETAGKVQVFMQKGIVFWSTPL
uniref:Uncharacterized protein n=1 Tax=Anguilla anguilla TaxID=7936 RepID=A0A0E9WGT3_ANGAN